MESVRTVRILVHGRVQGVGFRAWVRHQAQLRGVSGWVRNRRDGTVEAEFSGPGHVVDAMVEACRAGPRSGHVDRVEVSPMSQAGVAPDGGRFEVLATT